jgi:uncharacterized protein YecT (DUF1311 family)
MYETLPDRRCGIVAERQRAGGRVRNASTQLELNTCTAQQYQAADKKLNQTYRRPSNARQPHNGIC